MPLPEDIFAKTYRLGGKVYAVQSQVKIALDDLREMRQFSHVRHHYEIALDDLTLMQSLLTDQDANDIKVGLILPIMEMQRSLERGVENQRPEHVTAANKIYQLVLKMNENLYQRVKAIRCP